MNRLMRLTQVVGLNSVPVVGVVWAGWTSGTAFALYWCETAIAIFLVAFRVWLHRRFTRKRGHWIETEVAAKSGARSRKRRKVVSFGGNWFKIAAVFTFLPAPFIWIVAGTSDIDVDALLRGLSISAIFLAMGLAIDIATLRDKPFAWVRTMTNLTLWRVMLVDLAALVGLGGTGLATTGIFGESDSLLSRAVLPGLAVFAFLKFYTDIASQFPNYTEYAVDEELFDGRPSTAPSLTMITTAKARR